MHQEKAIVAADIMLCLTLPELNTVSLNVGMGQKDFTPPTIQLCSHLFLLCHQKTIFWRLLLLTTHLSSSNYSVVGQPSIKEVFLQRRRRHKQIIRQSTVQCPGSNGSKTSRNILGRGQGSVWSRKETLCCISV